jgi:hypothetical protein
VDEGIDAVYAGLGGISVRPPLSHGTSFTAAMIRPAALTAHIGLKVQYRLFT